MAVPLALPGTIARAGLPTSAAGERAPAFDAAPVLQARHVPDRDLAQLPPSNQLNNWSSRHPSEVIIKLMLILLGLALLLGGPTALAVTRASEQVHWSQTRWDSAGLAPDPARHREAIVHIYAARSWGWKGAFSVHSWVVFKPEGARGYERYDVVGWGVGSGGRAAVRRNIRTVDGYWAGNRPEVIGELRGEAAARAIPKLRQAIDAYSYSQDYRIWPGPNSNTFVASLLRAVPELAVPMPANAIGKDWLPLTRPVAATPSGTGVQLSLWGLFGVAAGLEEGLEVNILGLVLGVDPKHLAVKLPGFGSLGLRVNEPPRVPADLTAEEPSA